MAKKRIKEKDKNKPVTISLTASQYNALMKIPALQRSKFIQAALSSLLN